MSVTAPNRQPSRLDVHIKTEKLASYTAEILSNPNNFDPERGKWLIDKMEETACDIHVKALSANKIFATEGSEKWRLRYVLQQEAISLCDQLYGYITIAYKIFKMRSARLEYWGGMVEEARSLLKKWSESDVKRYGKL